MSSQVVPFQGFSNVALLGSKPPPQIVKERGAGWALPRPTGTTFFSSFFGAGRGRGKRRLEALYLSTQCSTQAQQNSVAHPNDHHAQHQWQDISYLPGLSDDGLEAINWGEV